LQQVPSHATLPGANTRKAKMADFNRQPDNKYQRKDALSTGF
jgi:hypothetical protein